MHLCPYRHRVRAGKARCGQRDRGKRSESAEECFGYEVVVGREVMPFIDFGPIVDEYYFPKPQLAAMQHKAG